MADIKFHSSEIVGFFAELLNGDMNSPDNLIYSFKESFPDRIRNGEAFGRWHGCVNKLHDAVQKGVVRDINDLTQFVFDNQNGHTFTPEKQTEIKQRLTDGYNRYSAAYQAKAPQIQAWADKNESLKNEETRGYRKELDGLCDLFSVPKNQTFNAILAFTPDKRNEGQAWQNGFVQYSDFKAFEQNGHDTEKFIDGSPVQRSKISTPLHEATHIMFKKAGLEQQLMNPQTAGMKKLMDAMRGEIDFNDPRACINKNASIEWNAVRAVDEAIAAASCKMVDIKYGTCGKDPENPEIKEWYAGFSPANSLAPHAFKMVKNYLKQGKQLDDNFFGAMADSFIAAKEKSNTATAQKNIPQERIAQRLKAIGDKLNANKGKRLHRTAEAEHRKTADIARQTTKER